MEVNFIIYERLMENGMEYVTSRSKNSYKKKNDLSEYSSLTTKMQYCLLIR